MQDLGGVIAAVTVVLAGLIAWRRRLDAVRASVLVTALLLFTTVNFFTQYAIWVIPFALLAGELLLVATIEVAMLGMCLAYSALPTSAGRSLGSISVVANHRAALFYASYCLFLVAVGALAVRMAGRRRDRVDQDETRSITR